MGHQPYLVVFVECCTARGTGIVSKPFAQYSEILQNQSQPDVARGLSSSVNILAERKQLARKVNELEDICREAKCSEGFHPELAPRTSGAPTLRKDLRLVLHREGKSAIHGQGRPTTAEGLVLKFWLLAAGQLKGDQAGTWLEKLRTHSPGWCYG